MTEGQVIEDILIKNYTYYLEVAAGVYTVKKLLKESTM